jgi:ribosomal protein L11 methyltransferase
MKHYKEFIIKIDPFIPDIVSGFLWELNITGINEEEDYLKIFADGGDDINQEKIGDQLEKLVDNNILTSFEIKEKILEDKNWNEEWEKGINIVEVSDSIVIKPSFKEYENRNNKIVITIDPKMSFGTGEHQTTKLVIKLLEKYMKEGMKILDVGTGTGILSIAAVKLGAIYALAIDNDEWCFENSNENCLFNNVADQVEIRLSEIVQVRENNFDMILANIQKNVLINISDDILKRIKEKGIVILSGLLLHDEKDIVRKYGDFKLIETKKMGEWLALVFQRK